MPRFMQKMLQKKVLSGGVAIALIAIVSFGYAAIFTKDAAPRYAAAEAKKGTLIVSISGSGQVSVSNQVDSKPKASGDVASVGVKNGEEIKAGTLIAELDAKDAQKAVRDAEVNLESAKLSLEKLKKPADALALLQAENAVKQAERELKDLREPPEELALLQAKNSLKQAQDNLLKLKLSQEIDYQKASEAKQRAVDNLKKAYEDGFNASANAYLDLPAIMAGLEDIFFDSTIDKTQTNITWYLNQTSSQNDERDKANRYRDDLYSAHSASRVAYTKSFDNYKLVSRASDASAIESLISETYETTKIIADAVKAGNNYIDFVQDAMEQRDVTVPAAVATHQSNLDSYTRTSNGHLSNLLAATNAIQTSKEAIVNAERDSKTMVQNHPLEILAAEQSIREKEEALAKLTAEPEQSAIQAAMEKIEEKKGALRKLQDGTDALDIQSAELTVKQRNNALLDAQEKLADYFVRAPFDGVIAKLDVKKGDTVSSGTVLATLITKQKIAEISLNEVDAANVKVGQRATLAFDAIPDLAISGQVATVDTVGAVSQGVVTYTVKIAFDTQDERVKTAMSVSAAIISEAKMDALLVPNSSVKQQGGTSYVEIPDESDSAAAAANPNGAAFKNPPRRQPVEIGTANDEFTEIVSGLQEGNIIVTRTIQPTSTQSAQTQQQQGGLRIPGLQTGGGSRGGFR